MTRKWLSFVVHPVESTAESIEREIRDETFDGDIRTRFFEAGILYAVWGFALLVSLVAVVKLIG